MAETTISSVIRFKQNDGTFVAIFPISTVNDVYFDIDNNITLAQYLEEHDFTNFIEVADDATRLALTNADVSNMTLVKVISSGKIYYVTDITKLGTEDAFTELITSAHIGQPGGVPKLDEDGNLTAPVAEFITYTAADIIK